jgi:hypothetical protein
MPPNAPTFRQSGRYFARYFARYRACSAAILFFSQIKERRRQIDALPSKPNFPTPPK